MTTHLAGLSISVNGRLLQRCIICGAKLLDCPDWLKNPIPVQSLVKDDGTVVHGSTNGSKLVSLPPDICFDLIED